MNRTRTLILDGGVLCTNAPRISTIRPSVFRRKFGGRPKFLIGLIGLFAVAQALRPPTAAWRLRCRSGFPDIIFFRGPKTVRLESCSKPDLHHATTSPGPPYWKLSIDERDLFIAALQKDPSDRPAFLDQACGGHPALKRRIEGLLTAHDVARRQLDLTAQADSSDDATDPAGMTGPIVDANASVDDRSTVDATIRIVRMTTLEPTDPARHSLRPYVPRPITEGPGTRIGPYKLLQKIGEGGMGTVYMAEQEKPVRRRVALKIIKPGMDTDQVVARFEAERQALAMMDHPNIARVFDAGTTDTGRPYFVMELVNGIPITDYCDQAGSRRTSGSSSSCRSARRSSTPTRRGSSTATSSRRTCW